MYQFVLAALLLFEAGFVLAYNRTETEERFSKDCLHRKCAGIEIKLPFHLDTSPSFCGPDLGIKLSCSKDRNTLSFAFPNVGTVKVTAIDYNQFYHPSLTILFPDSWASCPLQKLFDLNFTDLTLPLSYSTTLALLNCSKEVKTDNVTRISSPISCLSSDNNFVYVADAGELMEKVPSECMMDRTGGWLPLDSYNSYAAWEQTLDYFLQERKMNISLSSGEGMGDICNSCNRKEVCVYDYVQDNAYCSQPYKKTDSHSEAIITGASVGGVLLLIIVVSIMLYIQRKSDRQKEVRLKVEKFLESYNGHKPTRYTFKDLKKITKRFKNKLGQGGYGSVYKGELPNGIPVAVKMLEKTKGKGEEFINEVSTIGTIHHVNIVRLVGFCSEGARRALVYEFMPKDSLEKYIFSREVNQGKSTFSMKQLLDIAIGVARGIEYLHQGCNQRILHFDIKPHNILLDYDFRPKIADFGLAKLCAKEQSIVTMTAARGTMGYIAPELYSRNFGTVSYKSDVYSFGMLLLEMIGGRKNLDPDIQNQSQIYFPEWVYDQVVNKQELRLIADMKENEEEIARKISLVALWCIQWSPAERPTMTRVLQMLIEDSESLEVPPKPFVSGDELDAT